MIFNPDLPEQRQEVIFSRKTGKVNHPKVMFNNAHSLVKNHLDMHLDDKLNFHKDYMKWLPKQTNKGNTFTRKPFKVLTKNVIVTIYKSFVRPHTDILIWSRKSEQYNNALTINGAIKGTLQINISIPRTT